MGDRRLVASTKRATVLGTTSCNEVTELVVCVDGECRPAHGLGKIPLSASEPGLFIETEDPRWLVEMRIHGFATGLGLRQGDDLEKYGFYFACTGPFELKQCEGELLALINEVNPDWVVLSTLQGLLGGADWSQQKDMGPINAIMVKLQRRVPLVAITHSPRDTKARRSAGTITQDANYLTVMHFQKDPKNGVVSVIGDSKMGVELSFDLRLITEKVINQEGKASDEVRRVVHESHKVTKKELILDYRAENPNASTEEIADATDSSVQHVRKVLKTKPPVPIAPPDLFAEQQDTPENKDLQ